jgi:hypothetical protein
MSVRLVKASDHTEFCRRKEQFGCMKMVRNLQLIAPSRTDNLERKLWKQIVSGASTVKGEAICKS